MIMARDAVLILRAPVETKEALRRAAESDARTMSSLALKILSDWLRDHGHLAGPRTPPVRRRR
jgi:hypothetical protein